MNFSKIYCGGPILDQVQRTKLFDDDKHFSRQKHVQDIFIFIIECFEEPGTEFEPWTPSDWHDKWDPAFLEGIADGVLRDWTEKMHSPWKFLCRKVTLTIKVNLSCVRFRELYYWDAYWVINGLLLSEMTDTAYGMIQNFLHLVNRYGFVPNGGRIYYEFLTPMVEIVVVFLGNPCFYFPLSSDRKEPLWIDLKSGAESGWDFSSRWYKGGHGQNKGTLRDTRTRHILPTDLNALDSESAALHDQAAALRLEAVESVLWDAERGARFDYNLVTRSKHFGLYPSNLAPLWAQCFSWPEMVERAAEYLKASGALWDSGQQWGHPNAWPPLRHMLIDGLSKLPSADAKQLAFDLAQRWIRTNWLAYPKCGGMFEKVNLLRSQPLRLGFGWTSGMALQLLVQYGANLTSEVRPPLLLPLVISQ
uniref:Trehalase n=1 Tax=Mola mola TaxID=94237 RepID=A0A3Q3VZC7_MOLML